MSFGRCSCEVLPIHPGALHFNQYHIKFNTCFEMCTRSKALPQDGGGGACCKNTYHPSHYSTSNYLSPLAEPGELSTPAHCQPKERLWGQSRKDSWMLWGSPWLFVNPAGCMEEAFPIVTRTQKCTAIGEVAVKTLEFYQGFSCSKLLSKSSLLQQYTRTPTYQKLKNLGQQTHIHQKTATVNWVL